MRDAGGRTCESCTMTGSLTLRKLTPADSTVLASWQTDALFAAHAGWRLTSNPADGEQWWRESIVAPDPCWSA